MNVAVSLLTVLHRARRSCEHNLGKLVLKEEGNASIFVMPGKRETEKSLRLVSLASRLCDSGGQEFL